MEFLGHRVTVWMPFWEPPDCFPQWQHHFMIPQSVYEGSFLSTSSPTLVIIRIFDHSHPSGYGVISLCISTYTPLTPGITGLLSGPSVLPFLECVSCDRMIPSLLLLPPCTRHNALEIDPCHCAPFHPSLSCIPSHGWFTLGMSSCSYA